jgi:hypothetical protein
LLLTVIPRGFYGKLIIWELVSRKKAPSKKTYNKKINTGNN